MGLFDFLRSKDEKAIPDPGTPEFDAAVAGSAIPDDKSVPMGQSGWTNPDSAHHALEQLGIDPSKAQVTQQPTQVVNLQGSGAKEQIVKVLREHGIDPDKKGQTIDASTVPGLQNAIFSALGQAGVQIPEAGGFGGGVAPPPQDELDQIAHLAKQRDAGQITEAEFEAQKRRLLGS